MSELETCIKAKSTNRIAVEVCILLEPGINELHVQDYYGRIDYSKLPNNYKPI